MLNGVSAAGFTIIVHPAASAGAILRVPIARGKFHGVIASVGPTGSLVTRMRPLPDGEDVEVTRGVRREGVRFRMTHERWRSLGHPRVEVGGLTDACRELLGA